MKKLTGLEDEELLKKEKSARITTYVLFVILLAARGFSIYNYLEKGFSNTTIMPVFALALLLTNFSTLRSIKKEMEMRGLK